MQVNSVDSEKYISALAQHPPFRFVDRILELDEVKVVAELERGNLPQRFIAGEAVDTYVMLEFAAQSSGMVLRSKKGDRRGVISSFNNVKRVLEREFSFPIRLESLLVESRKPFYTFNFSVSCQEELALTGSVCIYIG